MKFLILVFTILSPTVSVCAVEVDDDVVIAEDDTESMEDLISDLNDGVVLPNAVQSDEQVTTEFTEVDQPVTFALVGSNGVYNQAWSGSVLDYFLGVVRKDPFCDYVIFRMDNSVYYCYYGDITLQNGYFTGTGLKCVYYEANNYNSPVISFSTRNLSLSADGFIYSNLGSFSDPLSSDLKGVQLQYVQVVSICILIGITFVFAILRST